ncbi:MAG: ubiquinone/menaquinone biosynthesis methyltransferase [Armatimonadetes bacterium]|nr:ubiquinone/menaquinone biosynthesis methyltransferase [Armatimonadota bacterium]
MGATLETAAWEKTGEDKRRAVRAMFAEIADHYDIVNGLVSFQLHQAWRKAAVTAIGLDLGEKVLDVCCGTGDFCEAAAACVGSEGQVVGVDFCAPMLRQAARKVGGRARLGLADAMRLPFASRSFDAVTVGWGLRNVPDPQAALREIARVLRPGGRFVSVDMARPTTPVIGPVAEAACHMAVPFVGRLFGHDEAYTYLPKSAYKFMDRDALAAALNAAGIGQVQHQDFMFGNVCMMWGARP